MALARLDLALHLGYDAEQVAPTLLQAETRVRAYLASRASASAVLLAADETDESDGTVAAVPLALSELVFAVAKRLAMVPDQVMQGAISEQSGQEGRAWGSQAYAGTSDLTEAEKRKLDSMYPRTPRSTTLIP